MMSVKKTDCPLLQIGVKRTWKTVTLETKMLVNRKMEAGEKCANVCRSLGLAAATVSTILANDEKIKHSTQKTQKLRPSNVSYTRNFHIEKMRQLPTLWVDDLNQKKNSSHSACYCCKGLDSFWRNSTKRRWKRDIQCKWFARFKQRSQIHCIKISGEAASAADIEATRAFTAEFKKIIEDNDFPPDLVFDVDETGLYWK